MKRTVYCFILLFSLILLSTLFSSLSAQTIHYVTQAGAGAKDGSSWANAFEGLQPALDAAQPGDQIWVAAGTYHPTYDYGLGGGSRFFHFKLKNNVAIYGGFSGTESSVSERTDFGFGGLNETILSGDIGVEGDSSDNCYHIFFHTSSLDSTALLDGFTIAYANADGMNFNFNNGGGMHNQSSASPKIVRCTFIHNYTTGGGGAVLNWNGSNPTFYNCSFISNYANEGAGVKNYESSPSFYSCSFISNTSSFFGGAVMNNSSSSPIFSECVFSNNSALTGGGIYNIGSCSPAFITCSITSNYASSSGGGIYSSQSSIQFDHCVVGANIANLTGGGIFTYGSPLVFSSCRIDSNKSYGSGGGIYSEDSPVTIHNSSLSSNFGEYNGGTIYSTSGSSEISLYNCLITRNTADNAAVLFMMHGTQSVSFINCTIADNTAQSFVILYGWQASSVYFKNCIVWRNWSSHKLFLSYGVGIYLYSTCYENPPNAVEVVGSGSFNADEYCTTDDPVFINPEMNDYRVIGKSHCVDAGNNSYTTQQTDIRGYERIQNGVIDLGAYEWTEGIDPRGTRTYYVNHGAEGNGKGTSWNNAITSLQQALAVADSGDMIWVARGTYKPTSTNGLGDPVEQPRLKHFQLKNGVRLYGGFAGNETSVEQRTNFGHEQSNETILSGDIGIEGDSSDNCYHVFYHPPTLALPDTVVIDGFTIRDGNANSEGEHSYGGGACNLGTSQIKNIVIRNCSFISNRADYGGGIILDEATNAIISHSYFSSNSANQGGGALYTVLSAPILNQCDFVTNQAKYGGALYNNMSSPQMKNCSFISNVATGGDGGAIINYKVSIQFTNCVFSSNTATGVGGALHSYIESTVELTNCTVAGNSANMGGGMFTADNSELTLKNSILWGNRAVSNGHQLALINNSSANCMYTCLKNDGNDVYTSNGGTLTIDNSCVTTNPLFVNLEAGDVRLKGNSPCINTGNNEYNNEPCDIRGQERVQLSHIDMGAYEWTLGVDPRGILYVNKNAQGVKNGMSWVDAFTLLQTALDSAQTGDQIWVAKGTYTPTSAYNTADPMYYPRRKHFRMKNGVALYGGFDGTETSLEQRTSFRRGQVNETILSGDIGVPGDSSDNCYHVISNDGYFDSTAVLDGFTITGGYSTEEPGGGMQNYHNSSPLIKNCSFTQNYAQAGGAVYNYESNPTFINCEFFRNAAIGTSQMFGGAVYNINSSPTFINCLIAENKSSYHGGAIANNSNTAPTLINCTITHNSATVGGAFYHPTGTTMTLKNCILWGDTAITGYNEIYLVNGSIQLLYSCCDENQLNRGNFGGVVTMLHCVKSDPCFANAPASDYRLAGDSPCLDAGNNEYNQELYDIRGFSRKLNKLSDEPGIIDIGAYEYKVGTDPIIHTEVERGDQSVPNIFSLYQNYPNPFNARTTICFTLEHDGWTTLKVYDVLGREVTTLVNDYCQAGTLYTVHYSADNVASGVYFYKLVCGNRIDTKRFLLLK